MSYHRYDPPNPRAHEMDRTSTGVAILVGVLITVLGLASIVGLVLGQIMLWVIGS